MKTCSKCGQSKDLADFNKAARFADGLNQQCRACILKWRAEYILRNRDILAAKQREWNATKKGAESNARNNQGWAARNKEKRRAHMKVWGATRTGRISKQPCEVCGSTSTVVAHHDDYSKPLDVRWLCRVHHCEWHKHNTPKMPEKSA